MNSYKTLLKLKEEFLKNGFDELSISPSDEEIKPFVKIFDKYQVEFIEAFINDIASYFDGKYKIDFKLLSYNIDIEDFDSQGATIILVKSNLTVLDVTIPITVKYLVFQDRILLRITPSFSITENSQKDILTFIDKINNVNTNTKYFNPLELKKIILE